MPWTTRKFVDQGGQEGIRNVPGRGQVDLSHRLDDRRRGRQGGHRETDARNGVGLFELALPLRGDAYRVVYTLEIGDDIWVVHAFQKKSPRGSKTPRHEIDLIKDRLKKLREML